MSAQVPHGNEYTNLWFGYGYTPDDDYFRALPRWACVAFAARCARWALYGSDLASQAEEFYSNQYEQARQRVQRHLAVALAEVEKTASGRRVPADWLLALENSLKDLDPVGRGAFYAAEVVRLAVEAAKFAQSNDAKQAYRLWAQSSAGLAGYAATGRPDNVLEDPIHADVQLGIWMDLESLVEASTRDRWNDDTRVPPEFFRPLPTRPRAFDSRVCAFCSSRPAGRRNAEDVIPVWLLNLAGRKRARGSIVVPAIEGSARITALKLPACEWCNGGYSALEKKAADIVKRKLLSSGELNGDEAVRLLDWADKVRIGLWRAALLVTGNPQGIVPRFGIAARIGMSDRILLIGKSKERKKGYDFSPLADPFFQTTPSCCALFVNGLYLVSLAYPGVASTQLGLPYPSEPVEHRPGDWVATIRSPHEREPARGWPAQFAGFALLAQAIWPRPFVTQEVFEPFRDRMVPGSNKSRVFVDSGAALTMLGSSPNEVAPALFKTQGDLLAAGNRIYGAVREWVQSSLQRVRQHPHAR